MAKAKANVEIVLLANFAIIRPRMNEGDRLVVYLVDGEATRVCLVREVDKGVVPTLLELVKCGVLTDKYGGATKALLSAS